MAVVPIMVNTCQVKPTLGKCLLECLGLQVAIREDQADQRGQRGSSAQKNILSQFHTLPSLPINMSLLWQIYCD